MRQHLDSLKKVLEQGEIVKGDRSGVGTISIIGHSEKYDLSTGNLPFCTTRKLDFKKTLHELIWFLKGNPNVDYLKEHNVPFWDKWTSPNTNTIGPMYPVLWRHNSQLQGGSSIVSIDQIYNLVQGIMADPFSRRHYISNISLGNTPNLKLSPIENVESGRMALDTCHQVFYVNVREIQEDNNTSCIETTPMEDVIAYRKRQADVFDCNDNRPLPKYKLDTMLVMRSNDAMVGKPHNIAQYSMLTFILAHVLNMHPGSYTHSVNDLHIYQSHVEATKEQINRIPSKSPDLYLSPNLTLGKLLTTKAVNTGNDITGCSITEEDFYLDNYHPKKGIKLSLEG